MKNQQRYGYATSLYLSIYLWEDQINDEEPIMVVEYLPNKWGQGYDIVNDPEKFQMYIDGELIVKPQQFMKFNGPVCAPGY